MRPWHVKRLFRLPNRTRDEIRREVSDEFAFHLDMRADELTREGMSPADARAQALKEFGKVDSSAHTLAQLGDIVERRRRIGHFAAELLQDAAVGLRLLARSPGFAVVAILTLALGIGANTAIYSVLDAVLLRPLPYPEPDRLMLVSEVRVDGGPNSVSGGAFLDWREHQKTFDALTITSPVSFNLRGDVPERLNGVQVSHEFLKVLGIPPLLGRGFLPEEDQPGGHANVVMITEDFWRSRFGADAGIVGRTIVLDEVPRTVIGVLPRGAWMVKDYTFFVPVVLTADRDRGQRAGHWGGVFGRLASTASVASADADLKRIKQQLNPQYPDFKQKWSVVVQPVTEVIGGLAQAPMLILLGAVSLVLLIACANVANLLLARGCHRQQELAVRAALGASGGRLVRQVLTENLMLALMGGLAGIVVAYVGLDVLRRFTAEALPITLTPRLDLQVLLVSLGITVVTGPLVGLLPALRARRPDLSAAMNSGSKGASSGGRQRTQSLLVVAEIALTVVLLASAGLLLRSLAKAASVDPGFEPSRILAFQVSLPDVSYESREKRLAFMGDLLARLRALPGVNGAGTAMAIPFVGGGYGEYFYREARTDNDAVIGRMDFVSPGYLEALGTRLLTGRRFTDADNRIGGPRVIVINEWTMRRFFPKGDAIGQPITVQGQPWQIVGVISDVVDRRLDVPHGAFGYVPSAFNTSQISVIINTPLDPLGLVATVRAEVARIDPGVAVASPRSLDRAMAESMTQRKVVLGLVGVFATAALLLAAIGLYGVMAYAVATRRREFGIRMAFGAMRQDLIRQVLRGGLTLTAVGLLVGLAGAVGVAQLLASELYQVTGSDPVVIAGTAVTVLAVAILACSVPAWRASRFHPMAALRVE